MKTINLNGGNLAMYHKLKRHESGWHLIGWTHPDHKAEVGDLFQIQINGQDQLLTINEVTYTNHPGIFGQYERRTAKDGDGKDHTHIVDLEPEHPFKQGTRFEVIASFKELVIKPETN